MWACGDAGFCGLLVWQKVKCANPNTIANPNTNPIQLTLTLSLTLNPNPTKPKLHARIPTSPLKCPLSSSVQMRWDEMRWDNTPSTRCFGVFARRFFFCKRRQRWSLLSIHTQLIVLRLITFVVGRTRDRRETNVEARGGELRPTYENTFSCT